MEVDNEVLLKKHLPFGLYYDCNKHENVIAKRYKDLLNEFNEEIEFVEALKRYVRFNDLLFISDLKDLSEPDFIRELNAHFYHYERAAKDMTQWFDHTDKLILGHLKVRSINNKYLVGAYALWSKEKRAIPAPVVLPIELNLESIFNKKTNAFEVCEGLLEHFDITIDRKPHTKKGRVGKLTGLITAINQTPEMLKLDNATEKLLLDYFNSYLKSDYRTFAKRNLDYKETVKEAKHYIKLHFKKVAPVT